MALPSPACLGAQLWGTRHFPEAGTSPGGKPEVGATVLTGLGMRSMSSMQLSTAKLPACTRTHWKCGAGQLQRVRLRLVWRL